MTFLLIQQIEEGYPSIILMIERILEEHTCKEILVNLVDTHFLRKLSVSPKGDLTLLGSIYIVNAMTLVDIEKKRLERMRNHEWDSFASEVSSFCNKYSIVIPKMDDEYVAPGRPRRIAHKVTKLHHYEIEIFKTVIDWVLQELNNRFNKVTTELLGCKACFSPNDSFSSFRKDKLVRLAEFYPSDFSEIDRVILENQLDTYIYDMKSSAYFSDLKGVGCLAIKLVETKKDFIYPLVYRLLKLVLLLPMSTASVERAFSAIKIVKTRLRNKIGDDWMNDCLVTYIEKEVLQNVVDETIIKIFKI